ncbi:unnamed protein product [Penicillium salamii]|uniref:Uncharacterized protein n=1 Tax=Penicillium salamii TaxID=1612424 RepID=A0A9W4JF49_9EURO|nr:unnamed protein product [Penicillium salamii]CAG8114007.1 unnamed protein product [Penicillium salamii]CAG8127385.1 unnamed protein product [Penicillium salamii]CAG8261984.1 unnamed protein product [Penicillium salamii]CAG8274663.1 unnamed protein product [Penicillium salamii]
MFSPGSNSSQTTTVSTIASQSKKSRPPSWGYYCMTGDYEDDRDLELLKKGDLNQLQRYRLQDHLRRNSVQFQKGPSDHRIRDVSPLLLGTEEDLREVVQEEIAIRQKDAGSPTSESSIRLDSLQEKYWQLSQQWWRWRFSLEPGSQERAFELWRSHPRWYMHRDLIKECTSRQGCCSRDCGCCVNRKVDESRHLGVGHCTLECACCERARGFKIFSKTKERVKKMYQIEYSAEKSAILDYRSLKIIRLSMFGITGGNWKNPFDMIEDVPPGYDQISKNAQ